MTRPLRLHLVTEEDPFYIPIFFRTFFERLPRDRFTVTGLDVTPPLNQKTRLALARRLHAFYGSLDFTRLALRYAVARAKDQLMPREGWAGTIQRIAGRKGIPCQDVPNVNAPAYVERLRGLDLDLLVSVAASQIFKEALLGVPRLDAINIHTGALPQYRGMMPVFWQLRDGRPSIGITIHTMTTKIDLGQILLRREVPVDPAETLDRVMQRMKHEGALAMVDLMEQYSAGTVTRSAMDQGQAGYRSFPGRDDARALRIAGRRFL